MQWIAPSEKDAASSSLEKRLWDAADQFRANSGLKAQEYSGPILGLIFLRFAEARFAKRRSQLEQAGYGYTRESPLRVIYGNIFYIMQISRRKSAFAINTGCNCARKTMSRCTSIWLVVMSM